MHHSTLTRHQRDRIGDFLEKVAAGTFLAGIAVSEIGGWARMQAIIWATAMIGVAAWLDGPIRRRR